MMQFQKGDTVSAKFLVEATEDVNIPVFVHNGSMCTMGLITSTRSAQHDWFALGLSTTETPPILPHYFLP